MAVAASEFDFNREISFQDRFRVPISVSASAEGIEVHIADFIPKQRIVAPTGTISVTLTLAAACFSLQQNGNQDNDHFSMEIPYNDEPVGEQTIKFPLAAQKGFIQVTAAALTFKTKNTTRPMRSSFMPGSIISAKFYGANRQGLED